MEAMSRLQACSFIKVLTDEDACIEEDATMASIASYVDACSQYKDTARNKSLMFSFWDQSIAMVPIMLQFIKADRMGDWQLHLSTTVEMAPHCHAMDRTIYARWLPVYIRHLQKNHPDVYEECVLIT
jgi:hypothetical protein